MDISNLVKTMGNKSLTKRNLVASGVSRYRLEKWLAEGLIEKIGHGLYKIAADIPDADFAETQFREATFVAGERCAICLLSALEFYGLTDVITKKTWLMVPFEKRIQHKNIAVFRTRNPHWSIGILKRKGYRITSLERTLIDCLVHKRKVGLSVAMEALKKAMKKKKTTLDLLYTMAKNLNATNKVKAIFEVMI